MAGLYNGYLLEFPRIRVDCFTPMPPPHRPQWKLPDPKEPHRLNPAPNAQLYLLTHVHTDHLGGLNNEFTGKIICSPDTKRMLLRLESEDNRMKHHDGYQEVVERKYEGLCARQGRSGVIDYIETLNPGESKLYDIGIEVCITLLDANHCPGSSMFLITTPTTAILHTGDVRADRTFRQSLRRVPQLQEFLVPTTSIAPGTSLNPCRQLDHIYIDTSDYMGTADMPEKEPVLEEIVTHMSLYPPDTVFFLNVWCIGWEDVVKEVARQFGTLVHVDRYKRGLYGAVQSDPFLLRSTTTDPEATRFHACERYRRCPVANDKKVVQVRMVQDNFSRWEIEHKVFVNKLTRAACGEGEWPLEIGIPIARHSPLPELQELVKMFKPSSLSPNTLVTLRPEMFSTKTQNREHVKRGLDYFVFPELFRSTLTDKAYQAIVAERDRWFNATPWGAAKLAEFQARALHFPARFLEKSQKSSHLPSQQAQTDTRAARRDDHALRAIATIAAFDDAATTHSSNEDHSFPNLSESDCGGATGISLDVTISPTYGPAHPQPKPPQSNLKVEATSNVGVVTSTPISHPSLAKLPQSESKYPKSESSEGGSSSGAMMTTALGNHTSALPVTKGPGSTASSKPSTSRTSRLATSNQSTPNVEVKPSLPHPSSPPSSNKRKHLESSTVTTSTADKKRALSSSTTSERDQPTAKSKPSTQPSAVRLNASRLQAMCSDPSLRLNSP